MKKIALAIVVASLVAACGSQEVKKDVPVADRTTPTTQPSRPATSTTTSPTTQPAIAANPLTDPKNILSKRSVYFDFDSNVVKDEFRPVVQAHARYMVEKKDAKIRVEGNCDERGSREYNLALGQRRAEAVKRVMTVLGVQEGRIETVSFGEEKPAAAGHDEAAWAQNRRGDIKYAGE
ncbi:MAG TPA: peptidoglycan-associated lipoprotein Pal [Usitatibacteraceae bacterium]|nr:peptidoglycan-associated lipoprotein Pal [Usitatibacteraceae bacterium]HRA23956.1 peptidoglycan-associated lipoprotein Pal [Usitatibacteraceae bacterium]